MSKRDAVFGDVPDSNWNTDPEGRVADRDASFSNESTTTMPSGKAFDRSALFDRIVVMPMMRPNVTAGGIIVPIFTHDKDEHMTHFGKLVARGTLAYKQIKWRNMGAKETDLPQIGEWLAYSPYAILARYEYKGTKLVIMKDEAPFLRLPAKTNPWDFKVIF